jgi:hypothetical protein
MDEPTDEYGWWRNRVSGGLASGGGIGDGSFTAGTLVAVPRFDDDQATAETPVEALRPGDVVLTPAGPARVRRVQSVALDLASQGNPSQVTLIRVRAGALGPALPRRDVLLPAEQLLYIRDEVLKDGVLVPVGALVNGNSIQRDTPPGRLTWYRLELETHGVLIAEGMVVATRREAAMGGPALARPLPPGPAMFALRARLARGEFRGLPAAGPEWRETEADPPALRLIVNEQPAIQTGSDGSTWHFVVPPQAQRLRLFSLVGTPATTDETMPSSDVRRLGVAVLEMALDGVPLRLDGPAMGHGFHLAERNEGRIWRWTDGNAQLQLPPCPRARRLAVRIADWHQQLRRLAG